MRGHGLTKKDKDNDIDKDNDKRNYKDNPRDLWHLRRWLQFRQLRTWIHDNLCCLTIKSDTGQHSQFLRCFDIFHDRIHILKGFWLPFWIGRCWCKFAESGDWRWLSVMRDQQLSDQWSVTSQSARPSPSFGILSTFLFHSTSKLHPKKVSGTFCLGIQFLTI